MIQAVIIDDEQVSRKALRNLVEKYCPDVKIVSEGEDVDSGVIAILENKPDLVFLDIEMPRGTGFDLLEKLNHTDFDLVFTTAYDNYAIKAFKFAAIDYLLKPIDVGELTAAVEKAARRLEEKNRASKIETLLYNFRNRDQKIALPTLDGLIFIELNDILRLEAEGSYTKVILQSGNFYLVSRNLKEYEDFLPEHNFLRTHKSHIVNLEYVKQYIRGRTGQLIMTDDSVALLSPAKRQAFLDQISSA